MNGKQAVFGIISIFVVVVMCAVVINPLISSATTEQHSTEQNTGYRYSVVSSNEEVVFSQVDNAPAINGEPITLESIGSSGDNATPFFISDAFIGSVAIPSGTYWTVIGPAMETANKQANLGGVSTLTFSNGTATFTDGTNTYTSTYTYLMLPDKDGSYGEFDRSALPIYVDSGKQIYLVTRSTGIAMAAHGTIDNMAVDIAISSGTIQTDSTITAQYEATDYNASNKLTGFSATNAPYTSGSQIFAPIEYTTISQEQNTYSILLGIIPLLLLVVPIGVVIRVVSEGRD